MDDEIPPRKVKNHDLKQRGIRREAKNPGSGWIIVNHLSCDMDVFKRVTYRVFGVAVLER